MSTTTDAQWTTFAGGVLLGSALVAGGAFVALKYTNSNNVQSSLPATEPKELNKLPNSKRRNNRYACSNLSLANSPPFGCHFPLTPSLSLLLFLPTAGLPVLWLGKPCMAPPVAPCSAAMANLHLDAQKLSSIMKKTVSVAAVSVVVVAVLKPLIKITLDALLPPLSQIHHRTSFAGLDPTALQPPFLSLISMMPSLPPLHQAFLPLPPTGNLHVSPGRKRSVNLKPCIMLLVMGITLP